MQFTDLIAGLAFINGHVGLYLLDKGLREGISIPIEQLQANVLMLSRSAQIVTITNQIQQFTGQAKNAQKHHLNAQHAQIMVQVGQLQLQLQQLQTERQRLELEIKKEQRLAQENQILRIFVDLYDQAQTYKQQKQYLDYIVVVSAVFRIYRQIYSDLDDANNRLRISELKDKMFFGLQNILESETNRNESARAYANALKEPIALLSKIQATLIDEKKAIDEIDILCQPPKDQNWEQHLKLNDCCLIDLENVKNEIKNRRSEFNDFTKGLDTRELFFPVQGENSKDLIAGIGKPWIEWVDISEKSINTGITQIYNSLQELPSLLDRRENEVYLAIENVKQLRGTQLLAQIFSILSAGLSNLEMQYSEICRISDKSLISKKDGNIIQVFDSYVVLIQSKSTLLSVFSSFQKYIKSNKNLEDKNYLLASQKRLEEIKAMDSKVFNGLVGRIQKLSQYLILKDEFLGNQIKTGKNILDEAVENDTLFELLKNRINDLFDENILLIIESQVTNRQPNTFNQVMSVFRGNKDKEIDRRRRYIDQIVEEHIKVVQTISNNTPNFEKVPALPQLPEVKTRWFKF